MSRTKAHGFRGAPDAGRATSGAVRYASYVMPLLLLTACAAPRLVIRPTLEDTRFRIAVPADTLKTWQLAARGDFERAEGRLAGEPLAQGLVDLYRGRRAAAERGFREVLDSGADSAMRSLAYVGLEALLLSHERYASLESLELRAAREHLEYDSTNRFVAEALNRLGPMAVEAASAATFLPLKLSSVGVPMVRASGSRSIPRG